MTKPNPSLISRRDFIKLGSGSTAALVLGLSLSDCKDSESIEEFTFTPNIYVSIGTDDTVTIVMPRSEMGQKIFTALPMILAEELEADWDKIQVVQGDLNEAFGSQTTGGSASIRTQYDRLREAGATVKTLLVQAAALKWAVPYEECYAREGIVYHKNSDRKLSYGKLASIAVDLPTPENVVLKDPKDFKIIGRSIKSLDTAFKLDGSLKFGYDFQLPGMLTAVIERIPTFEGSVLSFDDTEARKVAGVVDVVQVSSGVAVVGEDTWSALQGRKALKVSFDPGKSGDLSSVDISRDFRTAFENKGNIIQDDGNVDKVLAADDRRLALEFEMPYLDHAPQEPNNCTVHFHDNICEIWAPTQNPNASFNAAKQVTGFDDSRVLIHTLRMGGAFGRRLQADYTIDAVEVASHFQVPIKVIRTRDEDIRHGFYRPASVHRINCTLGEDKYPSAWEHWVSGPWSRGNGMITGGATDLAYDIPNIRIGYVMTEVPVPIGAWRSVGHTLNGFVNETTIDALATKAGIDPYAYRRELLKNQPRHLGVLDLVAEKSHWGTAPESGRARGIAVHYSFRSYCAMVAEVSQVSPGKFRIHKMTAAIDCGQVINPDGVRSQIEGGIVMGLTAVFHGKITIEKGRVKQSNFHNYKLLRMDEMPIIDVHMVPSEEAPTGVGEPPVPPTPPALINAIAALTGEYITRLPING